MFPNLASRIPSLPRLLAVPAAAILLLATRAGIAAADWPTDPATNVLIDGGHIRGDLWVVPDGDGGFVYSVLASGGMEIYNEGGRVDSVGQTLWSAYFEGRVGITVPPFYEVPMLASDGVGGALVAWDALDQDFGNVYVQHWVSGVPAWPITGGGSGVRLTSGGSQRFWYMLPTATADGAGGVVVAWFEWTGDFRYRAQRVGPNGAVLWTAEGVPIGMPTPPLWLDVVPDGTGGAIVLAAASLGPFAQRVDGTGGVRWASGWVNLCPGGQDADLYTEADPYMRHLKAVPDGAGGAAVVWTDSRGAGDIYAQRVDSTGTPLWGSNGVALCARAGQQLWPRTAPDGTGGVIVAWQDDRSGTSWDIYAQRIDGTGVARWTANGIPVCAAAGHQIRPAIAASASGGAIVAWADSTLGDIYSQRLDADGRRHWLADGAPVSTALSTQTNPLVVSDGAEGGIVVWEDSRSGTYPHIYAQRTPVNSTVPVLVSLVSAEASAELVRVTWRVSEPGQRFTVARSAGGGAWLERGATSADGTGRLTFEDHEVVPGLRYGYRLGAGSSAEPLGEVWVEVPQAARFALHGARPNPSAGPLTLWFSLAGGGHGTLELADLAGRRVLTRELDDLGPGEHVLSLGASAALAPGLYLARLRQSEHSATAKVLITR